MVTEWFCYLVTRSVRRTGFEPETLAFFLTTLGTAVCATATPEDMFRQTIFIILGVALYFFLGAWLRSLERVKSSRFIAAAAALGLLAVNVVFSEAVFGAKNWLRSRASASSPPSSSRCSTSTPARRRSTGSSRGGTSLCSSSFPPSAS